MPQIQVFRLEKKEHPSPSFTQMAPKHRLDHRPKIGIFPVTGLDIETDFGSVSFIIDANLLVLKPISTVLKPI